MPCFHPLAAWRSLHANKLTGKRTISFNSREPGSVESIPVPCGQCIGCRLEKSRQWAVRCVHEASLHEQNCFITLTYKDEHLPEHGTLVKKHFQDFMKRLRKQFGSGVRYYHCGEYGETFARPHYHACLFNFDFPDKLLWKTSSAKTGRPGGVKLYRSESLERLWPFGFSSIGDVTFESAAYVARYVTKKITGPMSAQHYEKLIADTGEVISRQPEYATMSRRPGIGKNWITQYMSDVYPSDEVVLRGKKFRPPKYYDNAYEVAFPSDFASLKFERVQNAKTQSDNSTADRLAAREKYQLARFSALKRGYENDL